MHGASASRRGMAIFAILLTVVAVVGVGRIDANAAYTVPTPGYARAWESDKGVDVTWSPAVPVPGSGQLPVSGYRVTRKPDGAQVEVSASTFDARFSDLTPGQKYTFEVSAMNHSAPVVGEPAVTPEFTAVTRAGAPLNVTARSSDQKIIVDWDAPGSTGGSPIQEYVVSLGPERPEQARVGADARTATISGLTNGVTYPVTVWAVTKAGPGHRVSVPQVLVKPDDATATVTLDSPAATVTTTQPHQNARIKLDLRGIDVTRATWYFYFSQVTFPRGTTTWSLIDVNGKTVLHGPAPLDGDMSEWMHQIRAGYSGIYTVVIDPQGETTGSVTFRVKPVW